MDSEKFDIVVIGAGIVGATVAAALAATRRVALVEAEEVAGFHSTGRSAALWILNYGPPSVRVLTGASRAFFEHPPEGFTQYPLMSRRPIIFLAPQEQLPALRTMLAEGQGLREIAISEVRTLVPALKPDYAVAAAIEDDAFDIDVAALHQGFLRQFSTRGGTTALRNRAGFIEFRASQWDVHTSAGAIFRAPIVVNAAGAWGDDVAGIAGVPPLGLSPCRRTGVIVDPAQYDVQHWPSVNDVAHLWYSRPEARTKLMISPADETPTTPHDVQPEELDIAIAVDRMQQAFDISVTRVERAWAGLRTFTPDRDLAIGWAPGVDGFFWCVGQGGYGIQTSPAAGRLVADLICGQDPGDAGRILAAVDPSRFKNSGAE
jgi:D-arginine dehydrogenase